MPLLSNLLQFALPAATSVVNGLTGSAATTNATNTLTAGGQAGIQTIQQGGAAAQDTLQQNYQQQQQALSPFITAGQGAAQTLSNLQPYTPQTFNWTPANLASDPAYQFRLQQGQAAIDAEGNAGGTRFSGATLKDLSSFNTGEAAQAEQQDYERSLGTFNTNEGNTAAAYKTNLSAQQNLESQGLTATGQQVQAGDATAQGTANIQTGDAKAIADLQTQIANAQAAGDLSQAATLQNTLNGILGAASQGKTLSNLLNPPATGNSVANPSNVASGSDPNNPNNTGANSGTGTNTSSTAAGPQPGDPNFTGPTQSASPQPGDPNFTGPVAAAAGGAVAAGAAGAAAGGAGATGASLAPVIGGITQAAPAGAVIGSGAAAGAAGAGDAAAAAGAADAAGGAAAGAGDAAAAAGGAGGGGIGSAVVGLLTNPITIAAAVGIIGITAWLKSQAHWEANDLVKNVQNPFGQKLGTVVDGFDSALASGQLTKAQAQTIRDQTAGVIQQFQAGLGQFSARGGQHTQVAQQAERTMAQNFGGKQNPDGTWTADYSKILGKMDSEIAGLPAQAA